MTRENVACWALAFIGMGASMLFGLWIFTTGNLWTFAILLFLVVACQAIGPQGVQ